MDARSLIKILEADGWYFDSQRGSHKYFKHPLKSGKIPVPTHGSKDIKPGTLNSILKSAGLKK